VLHFEVSRSVIIVQREFRVGLTKDAPHKNNINIFHHRAEYCIQNLIFHYFIQRVTERVNKKEGPLFLCQWNTSENIFINSIFSIVVFYFNIWINKDILTILKINLLKSMIKIIFKNISDYVLSIELLKTIFLLFV
jgi:hypothetical protein